MVNLIFLTLFYIAATLLAYHHIIFPLFLLIISKLKKSQPISASDHLSIHIIVPIYNEQEVIAEKVKNLVAIDYPEDKIKIDLYLDGCTDKTYHIIQSTLKSLPKIKRTLNLFNHSKNRGKLSIINKAIKKSKSDIIILTDASALCEHDAIRKIVALFKNKTVGAVCPSYHIADSNSKSAKSHWHYQRSIKFGESILNSTIGAHGALYAIRRNLFIPLESNIINDDFIIPMKIAAQGYKVLYAPEIIVEETESHQRAYERNRRQRIAVGNVQQVMKLMPLLSPRYGWLALCFFSGKVLRVCMPFCLIVLFFTSAILALHSKFFLTIFSLQIIFYFIALYTHYFFKKSPTLFKLIHYIAYGYWNTLIGYKHYRYYQYGWYQDSKFDEPIKYIHPLVKHLKCMLDLTFGLVGFLLTLLLFPIIALLIKLESRGPIIYKQIRVGRTLPHFTEIITIYKFRTMRQDAEKNTGPTWATQNDPRVTRIGKFLRASRLDEFPQFLNVLKGEMSVIGPRPERPEFYSLLRSEVPFYTDRNFGVKPGITGLSQVSQLSDVSTTDVKGKIFYDQIYALSLSNPWLWLKTEISIIFKTLRTMLSFTGF